MKKSSLTSALIFGSSFALLSIIFSALTGELDLAEIISSVIGGVIFGLIFTPAMTFIARKLHGKIHVAIDPGETVIKEGGANHFKKGEGVGGKLVLTDRRLIFKSHNYNIQNHQVSFDLSNLGEVNATRTAKIFQNGLTVKVDNNGVEKFIVDEPQEWISSISQQKRETR